MPVALRWLRTLILLVVAAWLTAACAAKGDQPDATAALQLADGTQVGTVQFFADPNGTIGRVTLQIGADQGAVRAFHGFHVHANNNPDNGEGCIADPNADPSTWFVSADGHLSDPNEQHSAHKGDFPPLLVNRDGTASATFTTDRVTPQELIGRTVIFHADPDNLGNVPVGAAPNQYTANSQAALDSTAATGNAGNRLACGIIR